MLFYAVNNNPYTLNKTPSVLRVCVLSSPKLKYAQWCAKKRQKIAEYNINNRFLLYTIRCYEKSDKWWYKKGRVGAIITQ